MAPAAVHTMVLEVDVHQYVAVVFIGRVNLDVCVRVCVRVRLW